jgi:CubicO group peptidase (beta-lactamase class C family)
MNRWQRLLAGLILIIAAAFHGHAQLAFVKGTDDTLWMHEGTTWKPLGGQLTSGPDACSWGPGRVDVFARGAGNALVQIARIGEQWTSWYNLGGSLNGGPTAVCRAANRIDVFAVGPDRSMLQKSWDGSRWTEWVSLGGEFPAGSTPDAASWGENRIDLFARGTDGALWQNSWISGTWSGWDQRGGQLTSDPAAVSWGYNRIDVFARDTDGQMRQLAWEGTAWSDWYEHGGSFAEGSGPDAAALANNRLAIYARGADHALVRKVWNGTRWSEWESLGGVLTADPGAVASRGNGVRFLAEVEDILRRNGARSGGAVSVGIVDRQGRLYFLNYGQIEPGVHASEDSVYSIGSNSKVLTAVLIKQMSEEQPPRVQLGQPAQLYLPREIVMPVWYPDPNNTGITEHITVRHLLTHRSGLPRDFDEEPLDMRLPTFARLFSAIRATRAPGAGYEYSNIGSELMTAIVEHVDRRGYAESLRVRLTGPLGMTTTAPNLIAHPRLPPIKIGYPEGGGYVQSTTRDMVKFLRAASRWDPLSGPILRTQTESLIWYGSSVVGAFHHAGDNPAADEATWGRHHSAIMADPQSQTGVVVLTQGHPRITPGNAVGIARDIVRLVRARPDNDVFSW